MAIVNGIIAETSQMTSNQMDRNVWAKKNRLFQRRLTPNIIQIFRSRRNGGKNSRRSWKSIGCGTQGNTEFEVNIASPPENFAQITELSFLQKANPGTHPRPSNRFEKYQRSAERLQMSQLQAAKQWKIPRFVWTFKIERDERGVCKSIEFNRFHSDRRNSYRIPRETSCAASANCLLKAVGMHRIGQRRVHQSRAFVGWT